MSSSRKMGPAEWSDKTTSNCAKIKSSERWVGSTRPLGFYFILFYLKNKLDVCTCLLKKCRKMCWSASCLIDVLCTEVKLDYLCWVSSNRLSINADSNLIRPKQCTKIYHILHTLQNCNIKSEMIKLLLCSPFIKVEFSPMLVSSSFSIRTSLVLVWVNSLDTFPKQITNRVH